MGRGTLGLDKNWGTLLPTQSTASLKGRYFRKNAEQLGHRSRIGWSKLVMKEESTSWQEDRKWRSPRVMESEGKMIAIH